MAKETQTSKARSEKLTMQEHQQAVQDLSVLYQAAGMAPMNRNQHSHVTNAAKRLGVLIDNYMPSEELP